MLSKVLTAVLLVTLVSCKKEYKKSENKNIETVNQLNEGKYEEVIAASSSKTKLSPRERYYLGSAYSQSGGIDVYSLYAVMEIQLFHKKALEWSDLSKEKNPYLKFMKNQEGIDYEKRAKKREERWEKFLPKIREKHGLKSEGKRSFEEMKADPLCYCENMTLEQYNDVDKRLNDLVEKHKKEKLSIEEYDDAWYKAIYESPDYADIRDSAAFNELSDYYGDELYLYILKQRYLHPEENSQQMFGNVQWEMLYMNILWNTYEAIPVMKKLPNLSDAQQGQVTLALETYMPLLRNKKFKDVTLKNLMILSGVSILSIYSASFDLDEVDSIQDLYCSFDPNIILENYGLIRKRILFIQEAYEYGGLEGEEYDKYKEQIESIKNSLPADLTQAEKDKFVESVDKFKVDSCFNG